MNTRLSTALGAVAIALGSFGAAEAQNVVATPGNASGAPPEISAAEHARLTRGGAQTIAGGAAGRALNTGWNTIHAEHCRTYFDGSRTWLYVYSRPSEGRIFATSTWQVQNVIEPHCALGNWIAFYVTNATTGSWNSVYTYSFK